jgi:hypothetical protein
MTKPYLGANKCKRCDNEFTVKRVDHSHKDDPCQCSCKYTPEDISWTGYQSVLGFKSHVVFNAFYGYIDNNIYFFCESCAKEMNDVKQVTHDNNWDSERQEKENIFSIVTKEFPTELQCLLLDKSFVVKCNSLNQFVPAEKVSKMVLHPNSDEDIKKRRKFLKYGIVTMSDDDFLAMISSGM